MPKRIFINLPVSDLPKATDFYRSLGFQQNKDFSDEHASCMDWSDEIIVMLLRTDFFESFVPGKSIPNLRSSAQVLLCLSFENKESLDAFADQAVRSGGRRIESAASATAEEQSAGAMYGHTVEDLDGHIWELLYMDPEQLPG